MFEFLFQNKKGEMESISEIITINVTKLSLSLMAMEKAESMIAKAIAKSEFVVQRGPERCVDDAYWMLNIRPNPNETGTDFWYRTIKKLLSDGESLVCRLKSGLYRVDTYTMEKSVTTPRIYKDVTIISNDEKMRLEKNFNADDMIHLKADNQKIREYLKKTLRMYNDIVSGMSTGKKIESVPKFALTTDAGMALIQSKNPDGSVKQLTIDQYKANVKALLESEEIEIITNQRSLEIQRFDFKNMTTAEDIVKLAHEVFTECAWAYDIPKAVFLGEITEKADSTNEFITFAVGWIKEIIEDSANAKLVDKAAYIKGEKIWIDMSRYKHVDVIESAANLDKLRSIGFSFDDLLSIIGWQPIETEFSKERVITKNYTNNLGGGDGEKETH